MTMDVHVHAPSRVREVAPSVAELLGPTAVREAFANADGKSGARMERVVVEGERYVLKYLHVDDDWTMRATGDVACRPVTLWRLGWLDLLPACIDHTVVGAAWDDRPEGRGGAILMRDVGDRLLPEGDEEIPLPQHRRFLDHMAQLHAAFCERPRTIDLLPLSQRLIIFGPRLAEHERAHGGTDAVPTQFVPNGWARFGERAPRAADLVRSLHDDPTPLSDALAATPQTLVHGDWKAGNLGSGADGRTILIDWAVPGVAPPCVDIAWYICLNRARLPHAKEDALTVYRDALERHGVDTGPWWERQLSLCLLAMLVLFGWEKALGDDDEAAAELAWWEARALEGVRWL